MKTSVWVIVSTLSYVSDNLWYVFIYQVIILLVLVFHVSVLLFKVCLLFIPVTFSVDLVQLISMNFLHCGNTFSNGNSVLTGNIKPNLHHKLYCNTYTKYFHKSLFGTCNFSSIFETFQFLRLQSMVIKKWIRIIIQFSIMSY